MKKKFSTFEIRNVFYPSLADYPPMGPFQDQITSPLPHDGGVNIEGNQKLRPGRN